MLRAAQHGLYTSNLLPTPLYLWHEFVISVLYGISIQLQVKWHIVILSLKLSFHNLHVTIVVCTANVWCKVVLWSPMQNATSSHEIPDYPFAGYDSSPHPSLALILYFNAWSHTTLKLGATLVLTVTQVYVFVTSAEWSNFEAHKQISNVGTHIKVHLLSTHTLKQVKRDCACMCSFSFLCLMHVSASSNVHNLIIVIKGESGSSVESMKPPRDMQGL